MLKKFDKYWSGCHIVMAIATIFDPCYKIRILEFYFPLMYESEASNEIKKKIVEYVMSCILSCILGCLI